ncbi:MAG: lamin tail domain-containing protein, partial [Caldilineaceae bacterium]|nr:lamin tail domain-containing protein [Caldilineaceae bacterium]
MQPISRKVRSLTSLAIAASLLAILLTFLQAQAAGDKATNATVSPLDIVVSEIAWMGTTASATDEWIELYSNTSSPINLAGWTLAAADGTPTINLNGIILAGGHFLLERTDDTSVPGVAADQIYTGALGNDGEDLVLRDGSNNVINRVDSSGGWFAGHNQARVPMVRVDTMLDGSL